MGVCISPDPSGNLKEGNAIPSPRGETEDRGALGRFCHPSLVASNGREIPELSHGDGPMDGNYGSSRGIQTQNRAHSPQGWAKWLCQMDTEIFRLNFSSHGAGCRVRNLFWIKAQRALPGPSPAHPPARRPSRWPGIFKNTLGSLKNINPRT